MLLSEVARKLYSPRDWMENAGNPWNRQSDGKPRVNKLEVAFHIIKVSTEMSSYTRRGASIVVFGLFGSIIYIWRRHDVIFYTDLDYTAIKQ